MCTSKLIDFTIANCSGMAGACTLMNSHALSDYVVSMQWIDGSVITILKVPNEKVPAVWRKLGRDPLTCPVQVKD